MRVKDIYFYYVILKFYLYLNLGCRGILEQKKKMFSTNKGSPLSSSIDIIFSFTILAIVHNHLRLCTIAQKPKNLALPPLMQHTFNIF